MTRIALNVNGRKVEADVAPRTHLADFLREQLLLTGTHIGCEHGICGACTVSINGEIARSCITYAVSCDGAEVRTIEGYDDDALMGRLRTAFSKEHALQCGYCTPGMLVAARDLVRRKGGLSRAEIRTEMSGNLCRCTGYVGIVSAIEGVMAERDGVLGAQPAADKAKWLGPAPGPVPGAIVREPEVVRKTPAPKARTDKKVQAKPAGEPIKVTVGAFEQDGGATRLSQQFVLPHPVDAVWELMADPVAIARCMPGMSVDGPPQDGKVNGRMEVKIGPISASFAGVGTIEPMPGEHRQIIRGEGGDRKSGSRVEGSVDYKLTPVQGAGGGEATRVDVVIGYVLVGPLAQISRSGIVRDLVARIGTAFAQNIDAQLRDPAGAMPVAQLGGIGLFMSVLADRVRGLVSRLLKRP